jgi:hypothetical protein
MFHSQTVELQSPRYRGLLFGAGIGASSGTVVADREENG